MPEVMSTDSSEKNVIVVGSPSTWPISWLRWLRLNRVKSGMFSESVAQNPIIAVRAGKKNVQNRPAFRATRLQLKKLQSKACKLSFNNLL